MPGMSYPLIPLRALQVKLFSRNMEDCTSAYPDVCTLIQSAAGAQTAAAGTATAAAGSLSSSFPAAQGAAAAAAAAETTMNTVQAGSGTRSLVCEAEIVGVEREAGSGKILGFLAFQDLSTRARGNVEESQASACFDPLPWT